MTIDSGEQHSRTPAAFSVAEAGQPTTSWRLKHESAAQGQCEIENGSYWLRAGPFYGCEVQPTPTSQAVSQLGSDVFA